MDALAELKKYGIVKWLDVKMICHGCGGKIVWVRKRHFIKSHRKGTLIWCQKCGNMLHMVPKEPEEPAYKTLYKAIARERDSKLRDAMYTVVNSFERKGRPPQEAMDCIKATIQRKGARMTYKFIQNQ